MCIQLGKSHGLFHLLQINVNFITLHSICMYTLCTQIQVNFASLMSFFLANSVSYSLAILLNI